VLSNTTAGTGVPIAGSAVPGGIVGDWMPRFREEAPVVVRREVCGPNRVLSNGALSISFDGDYGAISQVLFGGRDWYNPGTPVSDYAIAINGDFFLFSTYANGYVDTPDETLARVCGNRAKTKITVDRFSRWSNVDIKREYQIIGNAFIVRTTFTNKSDSPISVEFAETFDPDQDLDIDGSFLTKNSIIIVDGISAAQAVGDVTDYTVIMGSPNAESVVEAAGDRRGFFQIFDYSDLQTFLSDPQDGGGVIDDLGIHCGFSITLEVSSSYTFAMVQGFGVTTDAAATSFTNALSRIA
jgi:hypothetical protein